MVGRSRPALLAVASFFGAMSLAAQGRDWSPDDRVVIGDFTTITAVAASNDAVFAVGPSGVVIWRPQQRTWAGPYAPAGAGQLDGVVAALADPLDQSLWIVRRDGWAHFDSQIRLWDVGTVGGVFDAALDESNPAGGLFLRTTSGWVSAPRGSSVAIPSGPPGRPIRPASVQDAIRANPALQANSASVLLTSRMRNARYTSAARAEGFAGRGWYIGTAGAGLLYLQEGAALPERLTFGLPGNRVAAVASAPNGVWAITERTVGSDPSVSFVGNDLASFEWLQGSWSRGLPFIEARRLVVEGQALWLATDAGLVRVAPRSEDITVFDEGRGLPDNRVLDVAARRGQVVAGTVHGLVLARGDSSPVRLAGTFVDEARAVALGLDTVWAGTRLGLFYVIPGESDLSRPAALEQSPALQGAVLDLAWRADTLVALLQDRLLYREPGGRFVLGPLFGAQVGRVHTLLNTRDALFVAGENGVASVGLNRPLGRPLLVPLDLPGTVTDIAADDRWLWVATTTGLVRFRLDAVPR
jgi:ligand-binding sensor domain-containing protein